MNKIDFQQVGGFPLETDTLSAMQKAYELFNSLGNVIAPLAIISGCNEIGNNISDGFVFINNEILPFKGGHRSEYVIIVEEKDSRNFENGESKIIYYQRYVTFGDSVVTKFNWSEFYRFNNLKKIATMIDQRALLSEFNVLKEKVEQLEVFALPFSSGSGVVLWMKPLNEIPNGWEEVTELRGRFPIGLNPDDELFNSVGKASGALNKHILKENLPKQGIGYKDSYYIESEAGVGNGINGRDVFPGAKYYGSRASDTDNNVILWRNGTTENLGNGEAIDILNPNRVVLFIKLKK